MAYALHPRQHAGQIFLASGLDILAGIWILISPFILAFHVHSATTNNVVLGISIGLLAAIRFFGAREAAWLSWCNVILGIWVLFSPWILSFSYMRVPTNNNIIMGIVVIILAGWSALATTSGRGDTQPRNDYERLP